MNKDLILKKNRDYSEKFIQPIDKINIPIEIKKILTKEKIFSFLDLGCGDGIIVRAIKKNFPKIKIYGVDISPRRINSLRIYFPKDYFYCKDVCSTGLNKKFDFIYSSQVIEHVPSDKKMILEIKRLAKPKSTVYVSSVIKKPFAIYKYRNNGKFVLDPTHEREYENHIEFLNLFKKDFKLIKFWIVPVKRKLLGISIRVPGYYLVHGIWKNEK